ncbi:MAG: GDP-mannose 4,6-dehydratase [Bacteroidales bacterium]|nr:GDP-mannose 4,6-dehydratase [Bacteroidales bacterium]
MEKILVTGAAGFIGSHLVEDLVKIGNSVKAFVHYNSSNYWSNLELLPPKIFKELEIHSGDIRDYDSVSKAMSGCSTVFHLAALIGIPYSYVSPLAYIQTNVIGTYNILEAARIQNSENILVTSTSETYGTAQYVPIDEEHPKVGQSPYSATKIAADQIATSYYLSFGLPVKIVRPFNTYGPRQSARAIIPTIISQLLDPVTKFVHLGNLYPTRDLTYVKDTVKGFLSIAASDKCNGQATNIGMAKEISMEDLVQKIKQLTGIDKPIKTDAKRARKNTSEVERLCSSNEKLIRLTSWQPDYNLESGLRETILFFRDRLDSYKSQLYNI